jgi:uncharacterized protein (DUF1810 family)
MSAADPFELGRFLAAQEHVFAAALAELKAGRKRTHWMLFIFPQMRGLGLSPTAQFYGISSVDESRAFLDSPGAWTNAYALHGGGAEQPRSISPRNLWFA